MSGTWLGVTPKTDIKKTMCIEEIELRAQHTITNICSIANIVVSIWIC